jgi:hypothetical protein
MQISKRNRRVVALLSASGLLVAAGCDTTAHFLGSPVTTSVSGTAAADVRVLDVDGGEYGVEMIRWAEGGLSGGADKPCYLQVTFRSLNDALQSSDRNNTVTREVNVCNHGNYNNASLQTLANILIRSEPEHLYAQGVKTCDSASEGNERIKGVAMYMAFINGVLPQPDEYECNVYDVATATYVWGACDNANPTSSGFSIDVREKIAGRTNCGQWDNVVECTGGKIASAVRVHVSADDEITGLALDCDTVEYERNE